MYKNALKEDLIRVVEDLDGTVESTDTIVKLKTKIENSSTFESDPDFIKTLIKNCIDEGIMRNERGENQPVTALIDSGCQIPVLNSSLIRVQTPSEEIITLSSCFGEQRMVEVKPINISLNQHSPSLSVRTAISPTLTEEIIIHPSVYSEIKKLGHAESDVLLNESESSLGAHAYAYLILGSGNEGKREIVLNRRPELERKISMRSTKDQLVKKDVLMPGKQCFPVEPSGCRRGAFT
ncbi:hypothetical protein TNCV_4553011 [Trichonephila clavipes]|nr:hypothetical protein TNCV_4553011 [Trichonephila clavipes]